MILHLVLFLKPFLNLYVQSSDEYGLIYCIDGDALFARPTATNILPTTASFSPLN
jgi:hypothetical protein